MELSTSTLVDLSRQPRDSVKLTADMSLHAILDNSYRPALVKRNIALTKLSISAIIRKSEIVVWLCESEANSARMPGRTWRQGRVTDATTVIKNNMLLLIH
jgi:hypothetical protein